jgi:hypothetical protein
MHLHALDYVLWVAVLCVQGGLILVLHRRGLSRTFRFFYYYNLLQFTSDLYLIVAHRVSYAVYFYSYWIVIALTVLLTFALIDEFFRLAFRSYAASRDLGEQVFRWAALLLLFAAAAMVLALPQQRAPGDWAMAVILNADRIARLMLLLLTVLLLLGARYLGIPSRSPLYGFTLGLSLFTLEKIACDSLALRWRAFNHAASRVNTLTYLISCVVWLAYARYGTPLPSRDQAKHPSRPHHPQGGDANSALIQTLNDIVEDSMHPEHKPD